MKWFNKVSGYRLSSDDAYLVIKGLRTLDLRLDKHQETKKVANWLSRHPKIIKVLYPYKISSKSYNYGKNIILVLRLIRIIIK